jgi:general secretion pathway protein M
MNASALTTLLRGRWQALVPRERALVAAAASLLALALLWWVGVAPALKTLGQADTRQRNLDAQWQQMQALAAEAQALQARPKARYDEALRALEASVKQGLGPGAQLTVSGERATVTLKGVPASSLGPWLPQVRANARALPTEARLVRSPATTPASGALWDGTVVLSLPPR